MQFKIFPFLNISFIRFRAEERNNIKNWNDNDYVFWIFIKANSQPASSRLNQSKLATVTISIQLFWIQYSISFVYLLAFLFLISFHSILRSHRLGIRLCVCVVVIISIIVCEQRLKALGMNFAKNTLAVLLYGCPSRSLQFFFSSAISCIAWWSCWVCSPLYLTFCFFELKSLCDQYGMEGMHTDEI